MLKNQNNKENVIKTLLDPIFDRVLVACHRSPDGDATGSAFALAYALRKLGKKAAVYCPDPFGEQFSYLTEEENGLLPFEPCHFVTVDVADATMLCDAPFVDKIDVVIDHHRVSRVEAPLCYVCPEAASCGEILVDLIREMGVPFDRFLARALYTAIATDTGCFRYSNTTEKTFLAAAYLAPFAEEGDFYQINKKMFETKSRKETLLEADAALRVSFAGEGKIAYLSYSLDRQAEIDVSYRDLDNAINVIRQIEGVRVSIVSKEREKGEFKVSVRSEAGFDASAFCAVFGGGGHKAAAGCTIFEEEEKALSLLLSEAERRLS